MIRVGGGQSNFGILRTFMVAGVDHQYLWKHQFGDSVKGNLKLGGRIHFERFLDNAGIGDAPDARTGARPQNCGLAACVRATRSHAAPTRTRSRARACKGYAVGDVIASTKAKIRDLAPGPAPKPELSCQCRLDWS
mgnify:CR=1 FL=1